MEAIDGAAALRILQPEVRIDLLITDAGLPGGLNGRQVADAARGSSHRFLLCLEISMCMVKDVFLPAVAAGPDEQPTCPPQFEDPRFILTRLCNP